MADALYWNQRLARYGHTGWSDFATYWYDQTLRLKAIETVVLDDAPAMPLPHASALDFGCGVGDFCALLSERFDQVVGYDLSADIVQRARSRHPSSRIRYTAQLDDALRGPHDLILCVTVLQHVTDDDELAAVLRRFADALTPDGRVAVMETLADSEQHAGHLKRRTQAGLRALFAQAGFTLTAQHSFYHPSEAPTPAYVRYRARPDVRVLARLAFWRVPMAETVLRGIAQQAAAADAAFLGRRESPTKILIFDRDPNRGAA
jgi:2-polyprenyl-3-methyl-5-hydroxy-6-metoxy-1,4-benzoquinol methylase